MKNINPASMAQALMKAQRVKKELEKAKDKLKKAKFTYQSTILKMVTNGEGSILSINISEGFSNKELEREIITGQKKIEKDIQEYSAELMKPFAEYKDLF